MGKAGKIDNEMREHIALMAASGISGAQIGRILDISETAASNVVIIIRAAQNNDFAKLAKMYNSGNQTTVAWAAAKYGIAMSQLLPQEKPEEAAPAPQEAPKEKQTDNTAQAFLTLLEAVKAQTEAIKELTRAVSEIDRRLSAMQLVQSGLRGEIGEKIGKVVEAVNVNGDIITKEHSKMTDHLGAIKQNTKKRPWQEGQG